MLGKLTSRNRLTLPKAVTESVGSVEYFEVEVCNGQVVLKPVRLQRADAVRARLARLNLAESDLADAVAWARRHTSEPGAAKPKSAPRVVRQARS